MHSCDALISLLGITCGVRITEIARLEVADVLMPSGIVRSKVSLRPAITKGRRQRCIYLTHHKTLAALERYLAYRVERRLGMVLNGRAFRGLLPSNRLILTHKGTRFELSLKRRINESGEAVEYWAAESLQNYVTKLYRDAGLGRGYSSHSGSRTFANRLISQGESLEALQTLLGHSDMDRVIPTTRMKVPYEHARHLSGIPTCLLMSAPPRRAPRAKQLRPLVGQAPKNESSLP
jgi:integrase